MVVKILVSSSPSSDEALSLLLKRLNTLQQSSAGPFHLCFLVGQFIPLLDKSEPWPIPTYLPSNNAPSQFYSLPENFNLLESGLHTISNLTIACFPSSTTTSSTDRDAVNSAGYRGCDILLSDSWPNEVHQFLDSELLLSSGISLGPSSPTVSDYAVLVKPRYHFATGKNVYFQRPPYTNTNNNQYESSNKKYPCTRFIGLAQISESKEKEKKYIHALSLTPIIHMNDTELSEVPIGATDCPYVPITSTKQPAKRSRAEEPPLEQVRKQGRFDSIDTSPVPSAGGAFFFGQMGASRPPPPSSQPPGSSALPTSATGALQTVAPSSTAKSLFIGGLDRNSTELDVLRCLPGSVRLQRVEGKSFGFVSFSSHEAAAAAIATGLSTPFTLHGRTLSLGWAKEKADSGGVVAQGGESVQVEYEPPSADALVLFVGNLPPVYMQVTTLSITSLNQLSLTDY